MEAVLLDGPNGKRERNWIEGVILRKMGERNGSDGDGRWMGGEERELQSSLRWRNVLCCGLSLKLEQGKKHSTAIDRFQ